jgi:putative transposase
LILSILKGEPSAQAAARKHGLTVAEVEEWRDRFLLGAEPDQNAFIERFNRSYREEVLDAHLFDTLDQVREITDAWLETYNTERPHDSLGQVPPLTFLPRPDAPVESSFAVST